MAGKAFGACLIQRLFVHQRRFLLCRASKYANSTPNCFLSGYGEILGDRELIGLGICFGRYHCNDSTDISVVCLL
ncbi:hypothetical protein CEXT_566761 [Caerostris extrusa]|uniref:Secreted protein n=1 Tax=Caerostris extrusa TaxID=172846 RepID=A0AAV4W4U9_CAEEX|nr:hypothetical protein CEXT_566761 [Caerostris extrusa]